MGLGRPTNDEEGVKPLARRRRFLREDIAVTMVSVMVLASGAAVAKVVSDAVMVGQAIFELEKLGPKEDIEEKDQGKKPDKKEPPCRSPRDGTRPPWDHTGWCKFS